MQPYPRAPDLVWPGHLHGTGCLSARAVGTGFPTVGLRLWLGPGCGWSWVLFAPARCGWGLGWVCLGSVCGVVPLLPAVCGVRGWALVSACFRDLCGFVRVSLAPAVSGSGVRCGRACWARVSAVPRHSWLGCRVVFFALFFFFFFLPLLGVLVPGLVVSPPVSFLSGWAACFFFFFFFCLFWCPFSRWAAVPGLVLPVLAGWSPCACLGVLSSVPSGWGVWPPCVFLAGGLVAVGCFAQPPPPPFCFFFFWGGGGGPPGCSSLCLPSAGVWCGWSLATPGGGSCVLLPATPGWISLPVVVGGPRHSWLGSAGGGGVWCVALVCWWGCGCCVVWLVPRHSWRRFLCATPRHSWLGFAAAGGGRSPPLLAGVLRRWCVVCGVWRWCVGGVVAGVWCGWSLATPGGGSCVLLPATPGWVSLPLVVGGPRHSWLGSACGGVCGVWCVAVVCWWGCGWCVVWLVPRHSWRRFLCATPRHSWLGFAAAGGGRSPPLLAGVRLRRWCVVCGGGVLVGLWLVCGVVGPSPLLAEVPVCYSPPLLAGFRCRWWWAVPATPGWGPLAASVCGVWRWCVVGVVAGVWCGWSLATPGGGPCVLLPATPGWVSLPLVVGGPRHSWLGTVGGGGVWRVVCYWGPSPLDNDQRCSFNIYIGFHARTC